MPTFDFTCRDCEVTFEFNRPFGSRKTPRCPRCGSTKTEKRISPPAVHFKGAGFFVTDSRKALEKKKEEKPKETKAEKKEEKKPSSSPEGAKKEKKIET